MRVYPNQRGLLKAQQDLAVAVARGDVNHSEAQTIRGHRVTDYFVPDIARKRVKEAVILNSAHQHFVNTCLKSESLQRRCGEL